MVKRGEREPFALRVELTPELAEILLSRNPENRPKKTWHIQEMAEDIKAGRWELNGQTIVVSRCGLLNDGQNRSMAVVMADKSIPTFMVFGIDREARKRMDIGRVRTVADFLGMEGVGSGTHVAAASHYILKINRWGKITTGMDQKFSKPEITNFAMEIAPDLAFGLRTCNKSGHGRISPLSLLVTAHYIMSQVSPEDADQFMSDLIRGSGLEAGDPVFVARDKLMDPTKRLAPNERLKTLFSAWNNRRAGRKVRTLQHSMKRHEKLPELK
jgi:hypothetical protein